MGLRSGSVLLCVMASYGCSGGGGGPGTPSGSGANSAPSLSGTPVTRIWQGDSYLFAPLASDAEGDALVFEIENRPSWAAFAAATGRLSGTPRSADVGTHADIRIGVSDGSSKAWLPPFDLIVDVVSDGSVTVAWEPPTENTDDTPLDDLTGFRIYWGTDPYELANTVSIGGAGATAYQFDDLAPGVYFFATTAVNSFGIESDISDLAVMAVR